MTVLSRMSRMPKIPVARRSSVSSAKPFLMASRGEALRMAFPCRRISPPPRVMAPNKFSSTSVRPEPSRPAMPRISPFFSWNEASFSRVYLPDRCSTCRITSPGSLVLGGKRFVSSRPTIRRMISSMVSSAAGLVATQAPSRMMVTSSEMRRISSILWLM